MFLYKIIICYFLLLEGVVLIYVYIKFIKPF